MSDNSQTGARLTAAMVISMVLWGLGWPSNKVLTQFGTPANIGFYRYAFVSASLLLILLFLKIKLKIAKEGWIYVISSGAMMALYNYTFLQGLKTGSPGKGGILVTTLNPVIAYAIGMILTKRRGSRNEIIGLVLGAIAGLMFLQIWKGGASLLDPGNLFFLLSALIWSVMSKISSQSSRFGSPFAFSWWMYVVTLIVILPSADFSEIRQLGELRDMRFWGNLFFSSVIVTTLATTVYFFATAKIGAEKASSFLFTVPISAALSAYFILGEAIEIHTIIGGALGIGAVYMINRRQKSRV